MNTNFTQEQLDAAEKAKAFNWNARSKPETFDPVQLREGSIVAKFLDWWSTRSTMFCCLYPVLRCTGSQTLIEASELEKWREQLKDPLNKSCPKSMQGS